MTAVNILVYVALIVYILYRRVQGQPVKEGRRLFVLPILLIVLGYGDVTSGTSPKPIEIVLTVSAGAVSLGLGMLRGQADKLSQRDGAPYVQWGTASLLLFVGNLAIKLILDVAGLAAGSPSSAVGKSLVLTFGLTLLGEAVILWLRTSATSRAFNPPRAPRAQPRRPSTDRVSDATPAGPVAARAPTAARDLGNALASHHERHQQRHRERHGRR